MECMCAVIVGSVLLYAVYGTTSTLYKAATVNENQVLASNMAQQVIDNARDSTYNQLNTLCNGSATSTATGSASQVLDLYGTTSTFFPRPLLRNQGSGSGMTYSTASKKQIFNGTVTETLQTLNAYDATNYTGSMRVNVTVAWTDSKGSHTYKTGTIISQSGIHNY